MKQFIIIFEFLPSNNYRIEPFKDMLRKLGGFAFTTNNSCIVWANSTAVEIRDSLLPGLGVGDKLYVGETSAPAAWTSSISKEVSDYIIKNLK